MTGKAQDGADPASRTTSDESLLQTGMFIKDKWKIVSMVYSYLKHKPKRYIYFTNSYVAIMFLDRRATERGAGSPA